jgi:hypothetical protein
MSLIDYITFLLKNKNILDTNISLIYNQQNYENILTRIYQQLIFFENFNLKNCDIVDIGSGIGIHSNYFLIKEANIIGYEPNLEAYTACKNLFPNLEIKNSSFDFNKKYKIATLFGVIPFVETKYVEQIYNSTQFLIIDSRSPYDFNFKVVFSKKYFDKITNYYRTFTVYGK